MDYNINLKHESQKKFKMPSLLQPSSFERCFSTSSKMNVIPFPSGNLAVNSLNLMDFISGFHKQHPIMSSHSVPQSSTRQSNSFSNTSGVSVSCFVRSFVDNESHPSCTTEYCNGLLLDVLLNEISSIEKSTNPTSMDMRSRPCMKSDIGKRTYAEVTKEKPKRNVLNTSLSKDLLDSCDNLTVLNHKSDPPHPSHSYSEQRLISSCQPNCESYFYKMPSLSSSSSDSSVELCKRKNRSISDCSVDSDDSYIVFENDDEGTVFDFMNDESSDGSEEVEDHLSCLQVHLPVKESWPSKRNKKVTFKTDDELVTVYVLVEVESDSRAGPWEQYARDRERFQNRIKDLSKVISPILSASHRNTVYNNRFVTP